MVAGVMIKSENKYVNIVENTFTFLRSNCLYCGEWIRYRSLFCDKECQRAYFNKQRAIRIKIWLPKKHNKRLVFELHDIISNRDLKLMVEETKRNIDKKINKLKR